MYRKPTIGERDARRVFKWGVSLHYIRYILEFLFMISYRMYCKLTIGERDARRVFKWGVSLHYIVYIYIYIYWNTYIL